MVGFSSNIAKKILAERGGRIEYLTLKNKEGKENFFCLIISEAKYQEMQKKIDAEEEIAPADYGFVLYHGFGNKSPKMLDKLVSEILDGNL